jgi:hypothetical protein
MPQPGQPIIAMPPNGPQTPVAQPLAVAPVVVQAPAPVQQNLEEAGAERNEMGVQEVKLISHSALFYWWPVWVVGYALALVTYLGGRDYELFEGVTLRLHPNQSLGIVFGMTLLLIMIITNVTVRGVASALVVVSVMLVTVLFAYLGWWDNILSFFGRLYLYVNMDFYLVFSTVVFAVWALTTFVFDRLSYWKIRPGQVTQEFILGAAAKSYDTSNLVLEKYRDDLFRHWILGLGSGDLRIQTSGATREQIFIPNILLLGRKVATIQHMVATDPEHFGSTALK